MALELLQTWEKDSFVVSTDPSMLDRTRIHAYLSQESYWAKGIPIEIVKKSIENSLCFGVYHQTDAEPEQIGFARIISDYATFAYLADVYVEEAWRGKGLSRFLMSCIMSHPELQGLRRFCLGTRDAHWLYRKFGFEEIKIPKNFMEIKIEDLYSRSR